MQPCSTVFARCGQGALLIACGLLLGSLKRAAAAEPAGLVVAVRGDVQVTRAEGKASPLALKDAVFQNDTLETGERGRVQVCFTDDTILSMGRNTRIQVTECVFRRSEGQGALSLNVSEGVFRIVGGAIMKIAPENFRADTPTATIGIRGSSFAAEVTAQLTTVVLLGTTGAGITVENDDGYRIVYIPGTGLTVPAGEAPGAVHPMDAVTAALLGLTSVGGEGGPEVLPKPPAALGAPLEDSPVEPHAAIPGYLTDTEARAALAAALALPPQSKRAPSTPGEGPMLRGHAVGLDLTYGWALRSLDAAEVNVTVGAAGTHNASVVGGSMVLHAQGSGNSADTFPAGLVSAPGIPFGFAHGTVLGSSAISVTNGTIRVADEPVGTHSWGWWEMDMGDPDGSPPHHAAGLWQATSLVQTTADYVRTVLLGRDFAGTYNGDAHCLRNGTDRLDGSSRFSLDFRQYAVSGELDFTGAGGPALGLSGSINEAGISGRLSTLSGDSAMRSSSLRGFFYGAGGRSLQGAFDAQTALNRYTGIFDAVGTTAPNRSTETSAPGAARQGSPHR